MNRKSVILAGLALMLSACQTVKLSKLVPDRRPDYRQSSLNNPLEMPPDIVRSNYDNRLIVPDLNPNQTASYKAYAEDTRQLSSYQNDVLPDLSHVEIIESNHAPSYLLVAADANTVWQATVRFWQNNGIYLRTNNPELGLMETDWLEYQSDAPKSFLGSLLSFATDSGIRDRYRVQFSRPSAAQTKILILHNDMEEVIDEDARGNYQGYHWQQNDKGNPALQLEMTRRLAHFINAELRRADYHTTQH